MMMHHCMTSLIPDTVSSSFTYLGCYKDDDKRDLPSHEWKGDDVTPSACDEHCRGFRYFGVQV